MKRARGLKKLVAVLVFAMSISAVGAGAAYANYGAAPPLENGTKAAGKAEQASRQAASIPNPLASVHKVQISTKAILVTYDDPENKGSHRKFEIDYSGLVPGGTASKAAKGGVAASPSLLYYGALGLVGWSVLGRLRRAARRMIR